MSHLFTNVDSNEKFLERFERGPEIGSGTFGRILKVLDRESKKTVAVIKQVNLSMLYVQKQEYNKQEVTDFFYLTIFMKVVEQIELMKGFCHRNVARLYASFQFENNTHIATIMEICQTDLQKMIIERKEVPCPLETVMKWCSQMLCGVKYLHGNSVIHRDIKPAVN